MLVSRGRGNYCPESFLVKRLCGMILENRKKLIGVELEFTNKRRIEFIGTFRFACSSSLVNL